MTIYHLAKFNSPKLYQNRELSWLDFNDRVLAEASDPLNPLLEQLRFLAIVSSNQDEFYMVRVGGLNEERTLKNPPRDSKTLLTPLEQLKKISVKNTAIVNDQYERFEELRPLLKQEGIDLLDLDDWDQLDLESQKALREYFKTHVFPALTPLGVDNYRPFPQIPAQQLNLLVTLSNKHDEHLAAIVPIPGLLKRLIEVPKTTNQFVFLETLISHCLQDLFAGHKIHKALLFRVTRDGDLSLDDESTSDLLEAVEEILVARKRSQSIRLEIGKVPGYDYHDKEVQWLMDHLQIEEWGLSIVNGPLDLTILDDFYGVLKDRFPHLAYGSFTPYHVPELTNGSIFDAISNKDWLIHLPYDSFDPIVQLITQAATDPDVVAIKQTLYRVGKNSPIIRGLITAREHDKEVTVLVELKARFDEKNNVHWAKELEEAGCHVIYGVTGLKTHSKIAMVVRREGNRIKRYLHLGTGNYNQTTARFYTDMGLLTSNESFGQDATNFFNVLSGFQEPLPYHQFNVSPYHIRDQMIASIDQEIEFHKEHGNGHIIAKMNSLSSKKMIDKFYEASAAGVKIDLIIRGICCLRTGIEGVSDNITVYSVIGRFLEHSRIFYFNNNGDEKVYLSSADLMTRNLEKRVEIEFPIIDPKLVKRLKRILDIYLEDTQKARVMDQTGFYHYRLEGEARLVGKSAQSEFMAIAEEKKKAAKPKKPAKVHWFQRLLKRIKS
ncbi:RNA degradosome polyphosphate kinase [Bavariicoccus seileri]|uniref:RNA degradosome polyphosphate kinase n=1 Tax=Bavariicoccus seileri TaxID=549685 RepID=UPI0003B4285E|nr:RNA degradosome polyphosphate kinase [Bavariicoccus seileri]